MPQLDSKTALELIKADAETSRLDFKRTLDIHNKLGQAELIKDVLAMANVAEATDEPCFIIMEESHGTLAI